jgi:hypothetical protein
MSEKGEVEKMNEEMDEQTERKQNGDDWTVPEVNLPCDTITDENKKKGDETGEAQSMDAPTQANFVASR